MASEDFLSALATKLSPSSKILRDEKSPDFTATLDRWSNYDVKIPFAIVQPASEEDVIHAVREAVRASVPFVPASGGHSPWSTIGKDGIIIDLSRYKGVAYDAAENVATVRGGTLMTDLQAALHPHRQFAAVGNGNTVGVIPYYIGGGISIYTPFVGYGSENIVSAKLVTAQGELVAVSESQNPELLWGLRGAGQFLGLVTELTIRTYPYSLLGNDEGQRMCGTYIFLLQQLDAVCTALQTIIESKEHVSAGHVMIVQAPPDLKQQVLLVAPQVFCSAEEAAKLFQPLVDIGPVQQVLIPSTFEKHSDHLDWVCVKGDFKKFTQIGLTGWSTENFKKLAELHAELVATCPDAARSGYNVEWHSPCRAKRELKSSFGHENVDYWLNVLSWYTDGAHHDFVAKMDQKAQECMRVGTNEEAFVSYTNTSREDALEYRYKGDDRIRRLRALKREFDPTGTFTRELL
ncbi:FAD-binding domain-containing protein [Durotheca rogersii]|uniref:FAD-binding domain-containing protein n=1 Tax=Durotheca rogersii TaxID=419775 RepID=UPI00221E7BA0|nr:FAD-binding domain-containing protein [Durotheca rogersii]KAI5859276.1 FAD-binding domain-containing protein [Durotheca rogersii]